MCTALRNSFADIPERKSSFFIDWQTKETSTTSFSKNALKIEIGWQQNRLDGAPNMLGTLKTIKPLPR